MKLGLIRCKETENFCPGTRDFQTIKEKSGALSYVKEDIEIIGFIDCGGCPGKVAILREMCIRDSYNPMLLVLLQLLKVFLFVS